MRKILTRLSMFMFVICLSFVLVSCGKSNGNNNQNGGGATAEKVSLSKVMLEDVEFENSKETKIKQENGEIEVSGTIDAMSKSQKLKYGDENVTHVVALKFSFDKERTLSKFEIEGKQTKVYSTDKNTQNYVGSITDLLDSEDGEDSFCYLILSAETEEYKFVSTYTDGTESKVKLEIEATLATATVEE